MLIKLLCSSSFLLLICRIRAQEENNATTAPGNAITGGTTPGNISADAATTPPGNAPAVTGETAPGNTSADATAVTGDANPANGSATGVTDGNSQGNVNNGNEMGSTLVNPGFPPTDDAGVTGGSADTDETSDGTFASDESSGTAESGATDGSASTGETNESTTATGETEESGETGETHLSEGTEPSGPIVTAEQLSSDVEDTSNSIDFGDLTTAAMLSTDSDYTEETTYGIDKTTPDGTGNETSVAVTADYVMTEDNTKRSSSEELMTTDYDEEVEETTEPVDSETPATCNSLIYCQGKLLHTVQMARIFSDSKHFVDMSMVNDPGATLTKFQEMMKAAGGQPSNIEIEKFVSDNFQSEVEVTQWTPKDFNPSPCFLSDVRDPEVAQFASNVIGMWRDLGRKVTDNVFVYPDKHSLVPLPYGFISSGGRYGEYNYWDNYWIADALIICGMSDTVKGLIDNFVAMIIKYGFVPNGGRKYYARRSQPPMLPFIVMRYYEETTDVRWLKDYIEYFEQEMRFWLTQRKTKIEINSNEYSVFVYKSETRGPRPEAYYEDVTNGQHFEEDWQKENYYNEMKASAESGWDSSSRWIFDEEGGTKANVTFSKTSRVAPVDLNAYLYGAFVIMSRLYLDLEDYWKQGFWRRQANDLYKAINEVFWDDADGMWYDFDLDFATPRRHFYASNLAPLWTSAYNITWCKKQLQISRIIQYLEKHGILDYPGGIPSSLQNTGGQWDMPNVWPPMQSIIANGFYKTGVQRAKILAKEIAKKFVEATMKSYEQDHAMYQRYDAENVGQPGPAGEYETQKVFAWTNAVAIQFINRFYID